MGRSERRSKWRDPTYQSTRLVYEPIQPYHPILTIENLVWVDVEDLAETCRKALISPVSGHERFLVTEGSYDTQEIADIVRSELPGTHQAPTGNPGVRIADTHYSCDSSKAQAALGVNFRPLKQSIVPLAKQLYDMKGRL